MTDKNTPNARELTAHVRTAVDGSVRWLDRALAQPHPGAEAWDQAGFFARMMLLRGLERGELLGWVLQRDGLAVARTEAAFPVRQAQSYWREARPDLHAALEGLRATADLPPTWATATTGLREAREQLLQASEWLTQLSEALAPVRDREQAPDPAVALQLPEQDLGLDTL